MRAAQNLRALSGHFCVHLLVIDLYGHGKQDPDHRLRPYCQSWEVLPIPPAKPPQGLLSSLIRPLIRQNPPEWLERDSQVAKEVGHYIKSCHAHAVWLFRFYLTPWVREWMDHGGETWLDLDESESSTRLKLSLLGKQADSQTERMDMRQQSLAYRRLEKKHLQRFSRIMVSSPYEQHYLQRVLGVLSDVWPNVVNIPPLEAPLPARKEKSPIFFFIGNMDYFPNRDALHFTCSEILPRFRSLSGLSPVFEVAGRGSSRCQKEFHTEENLLWLGEIDDLTPCYQRADVVLVPLRTGGGTRIKILEALSRSKPVVSTTVGAEGLGLLHNKEIILADDADTFARELYQLLQNPEKAGQLGKAGRKLVEAKYSPEILDSLAAGLATA
jgi:glycosyltransferase involved in cell wall biosynthesis